MTPTLMFLLGAVHAPVSEVTVFADQARVLRRAEVNAPGTIEFPPLPDTIDPSSVRVHATGAEVRRVDLERLSPEAFRTAEAKQLLAELDQVTAEMDRLSREQTALSEHRDALARLTPTLPQNDNVRPAVRLAPQAWASVLQFQNTQLDGAQKRIREVELALRAADKKREKLVDRANKLGNPEHRSGWKVTAVLSGGGAANLSLVYLVRAARWHPTWDIQLDPERSTVSVSLAGLVSQASGEDWTDAQLTLSTAIPSSAVKAPKLLTWKIGTTERFIPTPTPVQEFAQTIAQPGRSPGARDEEALVRQWLQVAAGVQLAAADGKPGQALVSPKIVYDFDDDTVEFDLAKKKLPRSGGQPRPAKAYPAAPAPPAVSRNEVRENYVTTASETSAPSGSSVLSGIAGIFQSEEDNRPVASFSLSPPPGYQVPSYPSDSPITLAGGYDLSFSSRQKETIPSSGGARRVALWSQQWPVNVERRVYPALAKEAYLSADLKNPSQQVLPGGPATLSVGADPAGTAQLKLVSPGEQVTLPLGLDRAIKPVRNVQVVDATEGIVSKDDVSTYSVSIELVNPYRTSISVRVFDQWPLPQPNQKDVVTKFLDSKPSAIQDALTGKLEWRITLKPNEKQTLNFSYQVKRPKSWQLYQQEVRP